MRDDHPTTKQMEEFIRGTLAAADTSVVVHHLLQGCSLCKSAVRRAWAQERRNLRRDDAGVYDRAFERALDTVRSHEVDLAHERVVAPGLLASIEGLSADEQRGCTQTQARFQTQGFVHYLIEESRRRIFGGEPSRAVELARLAVESARAIDEGKYGSAIVKDLRASAQAELANAYRCDSDFDAASHSLDAARGLLDLGSGDRSLEARITCLEASLLCDLGRWEEALAEYDRALTAYRVAGGEELVARTLIQKAIPLGCLEPVAAVRILAEAEALISRRDNPRLFLCARHNRIWFLDDAGKSAAALLLLDESRPLYRQFQDDWMQLRLRWLEARIAFGLGHLDEAESALSLLWSFVFERKLHLDLALVTLDLTAVYLAKGEMQKAWRTAGRLVPLFQSWGVHRHAMAAWLVLQRAFAAETATAGLVREVGRYLQRSWKNPELAFEPAGD